MALRLCGLMLAAGLASACLWDVSDNRLFCSWDEPQPASAIRCQPTMEPMRSDKGTVYCGASGTRSHVAAIAVDTKTDGVIKEGPIYLDCEVVASEREGRMKLKCAVTK